MESIKIFDYNGSQITFSNNGNIMVNATEMAKAFNERPNNWLRTEQSVRLINALSASHKCVATDLVKVINGGSNFGTWMHEDVALMFAQWLSPEFYIWCNDRIKELLTKGATSVSLPDFTNPAEAAEAWAQQYRAKQIAEHRIEIQTAELKKVAPKAEYYDEVLQAENCHTTTTIAKELGMSAKALNHTLKEKGVIFFQDSHWVLYSKYQGFGYTKTRTHKYETIEDGRIISKTSIHTVWTEKGREFIHRKIQFQHTLKLNESC